MSHYYPTIDEYKITHKFRYPKSFSVKAGDTLIANKNTQNLTQGDTYEALFESPSGQETVTIRFDKKMRGLAVSKEYLETLVFKETKDKIKTAVQQHAESTAETIEELLARKAKIWIT